MLFSERTGIKSPKIMQIEDIDMDLRTGLWNAFVIYYWNPLQINWVKPEESLEHLIRNIWLRYFKNEVDELNKDWIHIKDEINDYIYSCVWYEVYDFLEFIVANHKDAKRNEDFIIYCNGVLEQELSAYRFVGQKIVCITSQEEISEISSILKQGTFPSIVQIHLQSSIELMNNRVNPDYRNSIKEAISAVEAFCIVTTENNKATLGQALKRMESDDTLNLHPALLKAFEKLYGYTSDSSGIRHSLIEEPNLSLEDARFMLVTCSAFLNYLREKLIKGGKWVDVEV